MANSKNALKYKECMANSKNALKLTKNVWQFLSKFKRSGYPQFSFWILKKETRISRDAQNVRAVTKGGTLLKKLSGGLVFCGKCHSLGPFASASFLHVNESSAHWLFLWQTGCSRLIGNSLVLTCRVETK